MNKLIFDIACIFRNILKEYKYYLTVVFLLAFSGAASLVLMAQIYSIKFKPVPSPHSGKIITVHDGGIAKSLTLYQASYFSDHQGALDTCAYFSTHLFAVELPGEVIRALGRSVTPNFFKLYGSEILLGRPVTKQDTEFGSESVVVISYRIWEKNFKSNSKLFESYLKIDERPHRIIGVMKKGFNFPLNDDIWVPLVKKENIINDEASYTFVGVQSRGIEDREVIESFSEMQKNISRLYPDKFRINTIFVENFKDNLVSTELKRTVTMMAGMSILAIIAGGTCVAFLICFRNFGRINEWYIRAILGYRLRDILRFSIIESAFLLISSFIFVMFIYYILTNLTYEFAYINIADIKPFWWTLKPDWVTICSLLFVVSVFVFPSSVLPVLLSTGASQKIFGISHGKNRSSSGTRLSWFFLFFQVSMTVVLLAFIALIVTSYTKAIQEDKSLETENIYSFSLHSPIAAMENGYGTVVSSVDQIVTSIKNMDIIEGVALSSKPPFSQSIFTKSFFLVDDSNEFSIDNHEHIKIIDVSPNYFEFFGVAIENGRTFDDGDDNRSELVAIIDRKTKDYVFGDKNALGKKLFIGQKESGYQVTIVGVAESVYWDFNPKSTDLLLFSPTKQSQHFYALFDPQLYLKSHFGLEEVSATAKAVVSNTDINFSMGSVKTMKDIVAERGRGSIQLAINFFPAAVMSILMIAVALIIMQKNLVKMFVKDICIYKIVGMSDFNISLRYVVKGAVVMLAGCMTGGFFAHIIASHFLDVLYLDDALSTKYIATFSAILVFGISLICLYVPTRSVISKTDIGQMIKQP